MDINDETKLIEDRGQHINYYPTHLIIESKARYEVVDDIMGKIQRDFEFRVHIPKYAPLEMSLDYDKDVYRYIVQIADWKFFFSDKKQARTVFEQLSTWKSTE